MSERKDNHSRVGGNGSLNGGAPVGARAEEEPRLKRRGKSAWPDRTEPPLNSVSVGRARTPEAGQTDRRPTEKVSKPAGTTTFDAETDVPKHIQDKYVRVGSKFHFPDGQHAFRVGANRTTTRLDSPEVVRDMAEIEAVRAGGAPLRVRGTKEFRAEAWRQAALLGIEVQGYRPSRLERAKLEREQFEQAAKTSPAGRVNLTTDPPSDTSTRNLPRAPENSAEARERPAREPPVGTDRTRFRGRLVAHGPAPYQHDRHNDMSYYAVIETKDGNRTVWGKGLEDGIKKSLSGVQLNDRIVVQHAGEEAVTVKRHSRDKEGEPRMVEEVQAYRNKWVVETEGFMKERAELARIVRDPNIKPLDAVKRHPSLAGVYLNIRAAEALAKKDQPSESARRAFVDRIRNEIAEEVAQGKKLPVAQLREQTTVQQRRHRQPAHGERRQVQERILN